MTDADDAREGFRAPQLPLDADLKPVVFDPEATAMARTRQGSTTRAEPRSHGGQAALFAAATLALLLAGSVFVLPEAHRSLLLGEERTLALAILVGWVLVSLLPPFVARIDATQRRGVGEALWPSAIIAGITAVAYFGLLFFHGRLDYWSPDFAPGIWLLTTAGSVLIVIGLTAPADDGRGAPGAGGERRASRFATILACAPLFGGIVAATTVHSVLQADDDAACVVLGRESTVHPQGLLPRDCEVDGADHVVAGISEDDAGCGDQAVLLGSASVEDGGLSLHREVSLLPGDRSACILPRIVDDDDIGAPEPWLNASREESNGEQAVFWSADRAAEPGAGFVSVRACAVDVDDVPWIVVEGELGTLETVDAAVLAGPVATPEPTWTLGLLVGRGAERTGPGETVQTGNWEEAAREPAFLAATPGPASLADGHATAALVVPGQTWQFGPLWFPDVNGVPARDDAGTGVTRLPITDRYPERITEDSPWLMGLVWRTPAGNLIDLRFSQGWEFDEEFCSRVAPDHELID